MMKRFLCLSTALAAMMVLSAPAAQAGSSDGIAFHGPGLDGRQKVLPDGLRIVGMPATDEADGLHVNGPERGRQVALPDGLRIAGMPLWYPPELHKE
jgi:hypothetical protein